MPETERENKEEKLPFYERRRRYENIREKKKADDKLNREKIYLREKFKKKDEEKAFPE
jgi:hypothetical protein